MMEILDGDKDSGSHAITAECEHLVDEEFEPNPEYLRC